MEDSSPENFADAAPKSRSFSTVWHAFAWLFVLGLVFQFTPLLVERIEYALARGRLRAEHELAKTELENGSPEALSLASQRVFERVRPSVVHIEVEEQGEVSLLPEDHPRLPQLREGQGSGVIIDAAAGIVVTNEHVVRGVDEIRVTLADGRRVKAELVGSDRETDLAVLRISAGNLIAADWGDSDQLPEGAMVWAFGSPFGLYSSVTSGIVSAKHRAGLAGTPYQDFLQTDCAVNPGSSGGPLVNARGELVGINAAIIGESYQGISFAIPSRIARDIAGRILAEGKVTRGWLGIRLREVPEDVAREAGLDSPAGALVWDLVRVTDAVGPAEKAGLLTGDIVLAWNRQRVPSPATLTALVADTPAGSQAELLVRRAGREQTLLVEVGRRPED